MPVYKLNKTLNAINTHTKDVDQRYIDNLVYSATIPVGDLLYPTSFVMWRKADQNSYYTNAIKKPAPVSIVTTNSIELTKPLSKLKNGIRIYVNQILSVTSDNYAWTILNFTKGHSFNLPVWGGMSSNFDQPVEISKGSFNSPVLAAQLTGSSIAVNPMYVKQLDDTHITFYGGSNDSQGSTAVNEGTYNGAVWYYVVNKIEAY